MYFPSLAQAQSQGLAKEGHPKRLESESDSTDLLGKTYTRNKIPVQLSQLSIAIGQLSARSMRRRRTRERRPKGISCRAFDVEPFQKGIVNIPTLEMSHLPIFSHVLVRRRMKMNPMNHGHFQSLGWGSEVPKQCPVLRSGCGDLCAQCLWCQISR